MAFAPTSRGWLNPRLRYEEARICQSLASKAGIYFQKLSRFYLIKIMSVAVNLLKPDLYLPSGFQKLLYLQLQYY